MTPPLIVQLAAQKSVEPDTLAANLADPVPLPEHSPSLPPIVIECQALKAEVARLENICRETHASLIRGAGDEVLLDTLAKAWKDAPQHIQAAT